ncbi:MAG: hypothetical protein IJT73_08225 [Selenomonadaceae bacterium]|nr:hypothetical protein [Selenomonadaceae bacterium]
MILEREFWITPRPEEQRKIALEYLKKLKADDEHSLQFTNDNFSETLSKFACALQAELSALDAVIKILETRKEEF